MSNVLQESSGARHLHAEKKQLNVRKSDEQKTEVELIFFFPWVPYWLFQIFSIIVQHK